MCVMSEPAPAPAFDGETGGDVRRAARLGFAGLTVGRAAGYVQANLFVLPRDFAAEFAAFCAANPAAYPLLAVGEPGGTGLPALCGDCDLSTDLPGYVVHAEGGRTRSPHVRDRWRDDLVAFAIGCWFGAQAALEAAGIRMRHRALGLQGPLFRTDRPAAAAGRFRGPLVASMRPFATGDLQRVAAITAGLPRSHGAPLHVGDPAALGITNPSRPDWGEPLLPESGETPVFWACGLTALAALEAAGLPFFISHAPGAMLVTDLRESAP